MSFHETAKHLPRPVHVPLADALTNLDRQFGVLRDRRAEGATPTEGRGRWPTEVARSEVEGVAGVTAHSGITIAVETMFTVYLMSRPC